MSYVPNDSANHLPLAANGYSNGVDVLAAIFVACLFLSNLIAGRLIEVGGVVLSFAVLAPPITYILDVEE